MCQNTDAEQIVISLYICRLVFGRQVGLAMATAPHLQLDAGRKPPTTTAWARKMGGMVACGLGAGICLPGRSLPPPSWAYDGKRESESSPLKNGSVRGVPANVCIVQILGGSAFVKCEKWKTEILSGLMLRG